MIKKTLNIYHLFSLLYALILSPTFHFTPFSPPTVISGLISPVTLQTLPIHSSLSYPLYPNSPTSLYFYHSIAVISLWHCFNISPLPHLSSISRLPLSFRLQFHLDLYVSIGLSILLHPRSKLKWFWWLYRSLIEFKKRKYHKEN